MEDKYAKYQLMKSIAKVCRDVGWNRISRSAFYVLIDIVAARIMETIRQASIFSASSGRISLGLTDACNALSVMGEDLVGLHVFWSNMPRVTSHSTVHPRNRRIEVGRINPGTEHVEPGLIEVHYWLKNLKKRNQNMRTSNLRRSIRIQERTLNGANDDGIFKKPTAPAPRAKKSAFKSSLKN